MVIITTAKMCPNYVHAILQMREYYAILQMHEYYAILQMHL